MLKVVQSPGVDVRRQAGSRGGYDDRKALDIGRRSVLFAEHVCGLQTLPDPTVEILIDEIGHQVVLGRYMYFIARHALQWRRSVASLRRRPSLSVAKRENSVTPTLCPATRRSTQQQSGFLGVPVMVRWSLR